MTVSADPKTLADKVAEEFARYFELEAREHTHVEAEKLLHDVSKLVDFFFRACVKLGGKPDAEIRRIPNMEVLLTCTLPRPAEVSCSVWTREESTVLTISIGEEKYTGTFKARRLPDIEMEGEESRLDIEAGEVSYSTRFRADKLVVSLTFSSRTLELISVTVKPASARILV